MTRVVYTGHEPRTFGDYRDLGTGRTLHAEPGGTYDIAPASGRPVPEIPAPWFVAAEPPAVKAARKPAPEPEEPQPEDIP